MTNIEELQKKIKSGDWIIVGVMLDISQKNAFISFGRPNSKRYPAIVEAIEKIVKSREDLLTNNK